MYRLKYGKLSNLVDLMSYTYDTFRLDLDAKSSHKISQGKLQVTGARTVLNVRSIPNIWFEKILI